MPPKNIRIFLGFVVFTLHRPPSVQYLAAVGSVKGHHYWSVYCRRCRVGSVQGQSVQYMAAVGSAKGLRRFSTEPSYVQYSAAVD